MTIATTLKKFETLKNVILKDGKVDPDEAMILLDFISPYVRAGNRTFTSLYKSIVKARMDNVITKEESDELITEIDNVEIFLKCEKKIETFLAWLSGIALVTFVIWHFI